MRHMAWPFDWEGYGTMKRQFTNDDPKVDVVVHLQIVPATGLKPGEPCLCVNSTPDGILTCETARAVFPVIERIYQLPRNYDWDTPEYRAVCAELGFDPDHRRAESEGIKAEAKRREEEWAAFERRYGNQTAG